MISVIVRKELRTYFNSPIAYIAVTFFLVTISVLFFVFQRFFVQGVATLRGYFGTIPLIFVFLLPAITMRIWAEEQKSGTAELLLTMPFAEWHLVLGKFLASAGLLAIMIALTLPVPILILPLGHFAVGEVIGEYIGMIFLGLSGLSVGIFISAISRNQISAFIVTVLVLLVFTLIGHLASLSDMPRTLAYILRYLSFDEHYRSLLRGLVDTRDIFFYTAVSFLFLFATVRTIEFRKWS